ncbi:hypothetical protein BgiMline_022503, partial [Biomphalaria glabrata]
MSSTNASLIDVKLPVMSPTQDILDDIVMTTSHLFYVMLSPVISVFGIMANIINICVYY